MTRDQIVSGEIERARLDVARLAKDADGLREHALQREAEAHAELYDMVHTVLLQAAALLREAGQLMDPEVTDVADFDPGRLLA